MILAKSTLVSKKLLGLFCYPKVFETFSDRYKKFNWRIIAKAKNTLMLFIRNENEVEENCVKSALTT